MEVSESLCWLTKVVEERTPVEEDTLVGAEAQNGLGNIPTPNTTILKSSVFVF